MRLRGRVAFQNVVIGGNNGVGMGGGGVQGGQFGDEVLMQVRPVGDRIVCMTSAGRIVALDAATGKLAWQARPGLGAGSSFVANEDFTVVRCTENAGIRLSCFDTYTGKLLGEKSFANNAPCLATSRSPPTARWSMPSAIASPSRTCSSPGPTSLTSNRRRSRDRPPAR